MSYTPLDYFAVEGLCSEEERSIARATRDFVSREVLPGIGQHFENGTFPAELIPAFGEMGFLGSSLTGYGCPGVSPTAYGLICQELERGDSGIRSGCSVQGSLAMYPIWAFGSEEQKKTLLPEMAAGKVVGCFGLTEPDFGSNPSGMLTKAVDDGDSFVLNGTKRWITNGGISQIAIVWAKLDGVVRGFVVPTDSPGFSAKELKGKWSLRASVTSELVMEDCRIPKSALLPEVSGMRGPLSCLNQARFGIAFGAVGMMMACFDEARNYALERVQFSRPIAGYQLVQEKLATMATEITKAQLLCAQLGALKAAGTITPQQISMAKRNNVYWAREMARTARDILGANGVSLAYQCGRHMMNVESVYTYEGTHDIHTLILGQSLTGLSAFDG